MEKERWLYSIVLYCTVGLCEIQSLRSNLDDDNGRDNDRNECRWVVDENCQKHGYKQASNNWNGKYSLLSEQKLNMHRKLCLVHDRSCDYACIFFLCMPLGVDHESEVPYYLLYPPQKKDRQAQTDRQLHLCFRSPPALFLLTLVEGLYDLLLFVFSSNNSLYIFLVIGIRSFASTTKARRTRVPLFVFGDIYF